MTTLYEFKDVLSEHPMFAVGLMLVAGYAVGKLVGRFGLPEITGYILAGLLISHSVTGILPEGMHASFSMITEIALSLVALTIGAEFSLPKLRRIGKDVIVITLVQIGLVFTVVSGALWLFGMGLPFALLLGVIATATEPAATVAEVHALKARGRFVDYLFGIVALDDAACVIFFSIMLAFVARVLYSGNVNGAVAFVQVLWALKEIVSSLILGLLAGWTLHRLTNRKKATREILVISMGILLLSTALAVILHLSPLLTNLAAGSLLINLSPGNHRILRVLEPLTPPVYALFFVIAGTELDFRVMLEPGLLLLGGVYIISRATTKYSGVYLGCRLRKIANPMRGNLGWCMLPQGGVALGLILLAQSSPLVTRMAAPEVNEMLVRMLNIILMCVFASELIGPPLIRMGIQRGCAMNEDRSPGGTMTKAIRP